MATRLAQKRILITAGPTWVPIDTVRVISNIATGETGILLAEKLQAQGAKVTLLLGPVESCCLNKKIKVLRFKFFDELRRIMVRELKAKKYDIVIHSAAVSDYRPLKAYSLKVKSSLHGWALKLVPTEKIIDLVKKIDHSLFLVGFKFESWQNQKILIDKTRALLRRAKPDLVIANTIKRNKYEAYIVNLKDVFWPLENKEALCRKLIAVMGGYRWGS